MSVESRIADVEGRIAAVPPAPMLGAPDAGETSSSEDAGGYFGGGESDRAGAFQLESGKLINCHFMFGRSVYNVSDTPIGDGTWNLVVPHANPANASIVNGSGGGTSNTQTVIPIFVISQGVIVADYRGMPCIPVYE